MAVGGLVIHLNKIHLTITLKVLNLNPKCLTLTLTLILTKCCKMPNYNFFIFGCDVHGWGYAQMPHPNPKSCSRCCKMPKYNFLFLGAKFMVGGMLKCPMLTLTLKVVPNVTKCLNTTFYFWL